MQSGNMTIKISGLHNLQLTMMLLLLVSCNNDPAPVENKTASKADSTQVFILEKDTLSRTMTFPGELTPMNKAQEFAKVAGHVRRIYVDIGDHVRAGQVIAVLDAPELIANEAQVSADVQAAKARLASSRDAFSRLQLAAHVEGTIALGELEKMRNQLTADSMGYEAARAKRVSYAQIQDYLYIRAPFNGIVSQRNVDPGTLVGTGSATPLFIIEDNLLLRLRLAVPELYLATVPHNGIVHFKVDAYPGETFTAKLSRRSGALDVRNRTETWEFLYDNHSGKLESGMYTNVMLDMDRKLSSFVVPQTAVVTNLERSSVIRVKDGKAEWVDVKSSINNDQSTEIVGTLNTGDTLVKFAVDDIKPGKVLITKK
jgi:RND family efflux transporter MFP subunit